MDTILALFERGLGHLGHGISRLASTIGLVWLLTVLGTALRSASDRIGLTPVVSRSQAWLSNSLASRFFSIAKPFWFPKGWGSVPIWGLLIGATVASHFGLLALVARIDPITKSIVAGLNEGYLSFSLHFVLPALVAGLIVAWIGRKIWPKNEHYQGIVLLYLLLLLMLAVNNLNVVLNFANGELTNAMQKKDGAEIWLMVYRLCACFGIGTFIVVLYSYVHNRFNFVWRRWSTNHYTDMWLRNRNHYKINGMVGFDNPDERIAADVDVCVSTAGNILLAVLGAIMVFNSFMPILKSVDPTGMLPNIAYVWSAIFTVLALLMGKKLVNLNFNQRRYEADFRYALIHVRNNSEAIAFYQGEKRERETLGRRFGQVLSNWSSLIGWTRNLGFVQTGSDYFTVAIPYMVLVPLYLTANSGVEMGSIIQASSAFGQVLTALTLIVSEFRSISQFTAIINRLYDFDTAIEAPDPSDQPGRSKIESKIEPRISAKNVTLMTPGWERMLVKDLTIDVRPGEGLVVMGPSGSGKSSLLRVFSGLWNAGTGSIVRPNLDDMMFLPQRPYMTQGTLREQLLYPRGEGKSDAELQHALELVNLPDLAKQHGGFDARLPEDMDIRWADILSGGEAQRLAFARLLLAAPRYAILDEATSALDVQNEAKLYDLLKASGVTFISVGHRPTLVDYHANVLELDGKGGYRVVSTKQYVEEKKGH